MAKGKGFSSNPKDWIQVDFVSIEMTSDDKKRFKSLSQDELNDLCGKTQRMIETGYKASITYDQTNSCFIFSLTCKLENHANFNLCLTSRSDNMWEAMALAAFKTLYLCPDGEWSSHKRDFSFG